MHLIAPQAVRLQVLIRKDYSDALSLLAEQVYRTVWLASGVEHPSSVRTLRIDEAHPLPNRLAGYDRKRKEITVYVKNLYGSCRHFFVDAFTEVVAHETIHSVQDVKGLWEGIPIAPRSDAEYFDCPLEDDAYYRSRTLLLALKNVSGKQFCLRGKLSIEEADIQYWQRHTGDLLRSSYSTVAALSLPDIVGRRNYYSWKGRECGRKRTRVQVYINY